MDAADCSSYGEICDDQRRSTRSLLDSEEFLGDARNRRRSGRKKKGLTCDEGHVEMSWSVGCQSVGVSSQGH